MSPEAAAHGVPGLLPRGRGLRGSAAPSFSRRKHIDAPAHPGRKGVTLARPLKGLVHCILTSLYNGQCGCPPGHAHRVILEIVDFLATGTLPRCKASARPYRQAAHHRTIVVARPISRALAPRTETVRCYMPRPGF